MSRALSAAAYDRGWTKWSDFIRFNPGARHRRRLICRLLAEAPPFSRVLDVGCGEGALLREVAAAFPQASLTGVDLSPQVVEQNRARLPGARFEALDLAQGPLDERFDLVLCSEVLEHLDDLADGVAHLAAMVAPGGSLLVTVPTGTVHPTERHFGHTRHPDLPELERAASAAGLQLRAAWNWGWPLYRALKWATNLRPEWALRTFAQGSYGRRQRLVSGLLYLANFCNATDSPRGCQLVALWVRPR